jgi:integrase/recombinase XerD
MNLTIAKLKQAYKQIEGDKSLLEENIRVHLIFEVFLRELGYDVSRCNFEKNCRKDNKFCDMSIEIGKDKSLFIETKRGDHKIKDNDIIQLANYIRNCGLEYGILTTGKEFILINTNIRTASNYNDDMLKYQIVFWFNIFDSKSKEYTHHDFFRFLSKEAIFDSKLTNFYRDIAQFKALKFPGSNDSWETYKSTLFRFFEFYANERGKYQPRILEEVNIGDFEKFINYKSTLVTKKNPKNNILSDSSIRNNFSHLSSMLNTLAESEFGGINKTCFDRGREKSLSNILSGGSLREYTFIDNESFEKAVNCYPKGDKGIRDLAIFLLCSCYGFERPRIQNLKWSDLIRDNKSSQYVEMNTEDRILPINPLLASCLEYLETDQKMKKIKTEFVFVVLYGSKYKKISIATINLAFNDLKTISDDKNWDNFSPQFVRTCLIIKLFNFGYSIEDIMYITGLTIENVGNYIGTQRILERKKKSKEKVYLKNIFGDILEKTI